MTHPGLSPGTSSAKKINFETHEKFKADNIEEITTYMKTMYNSGETAD
jgi:hypothetical protein